MYVLRIISLNNIDKQAKKYINREVVIICFSLEIVWNVDIPQNFMA